MRSKTSSASSIDTLTIIKPPNESAKDRCDHFELDRDWRRQCRHFDCRPRRVWFALAGEIFGVEFVVDRKIFFHVREEHRHIDNVIPACACVFENEPDIFKNGATLL